MSAAVVDQDKCVGCESCVDVCPASAIEMKDGKAFVTADKCDECGSCVGECGESAITQD